MRLHVKMPAPSVLKVLMFAAEAAQTLETVEVSDCRSEDFLALNPFGTVPVLETESAVLTESLTICRFLDRAWGVTGLFGGDFEQGVQIEQWERRAELLLLLPAVDYAHHVLPMFAATIDQQPARARHTADRAHRVLEVFEAQLHDRPFLAGTSFSMADITAFLGISTFVGLGAFGLPAALMRWKSKIDRRPCGLALRSALERAGL
jgi:glutathione S-transferase